VPVASAAAIVDATTADADHVLESVTMREMGQGEAHIEKRQAKKYETQVQVSEIEGLGWRRPEKNYTWPLVHPTTVATVWTAAATYGIAGNYVLVYRQKDILGNGMYRITSNFVGCTAKSEENVSAYTDRSITTTTKYQDAASLPDAADTDGQEEHVNGNMNLYNKYDYVKTVIAARVPKSCASTVSFDVYGPYVVEHVEGVTAGQVAERNYTSQVKRYRNKYTHTLGFHLTAAEAATAITGGNSGSGISPAGNYLWLAHKIVITQSDIQTWDMAEPLMYETAGRGVPPEA
jgi:hypothetical protein